jgi:hypothetical protein
MMDRRRRLPIAEETGENIGPDRETTVEGKKLEERMLIKPVRKSKRTWKQLCGLSPQRTGKPEWPPPDEIKNIWG